MVGGPAFNPQVRELKCSRCGAKAMQRMNEHGRFDKMEKCPKCGQGQMGMVRILTYVPND